MRLNSSGSALVTILVIASAIALSGMAIMYRSADMSHSLSHRSTIQASESVSDLIIKTLSNPTICLSGFDGAGAEPGLEFLVAGTAAPLDIALANSTGQDLSVPGVYLSPASGVRERFRNGLAIPNSQITLERLYLTDVTVPDPASPNTLVGKIKAKFHSSSDVIAQNAADVGNLKLIMSGSSVIECSSYDNVLSKQTLCEQMECVYTIGATGQGNCTCNVAPITCLGGTYVNAVNGRVAQCSTSTVTRTCAASAGGQYMVGLNSAGDAVCSDIVRCPAGTFNNGAGAPAAPPECRCPNVGDIWNGTTCTAAPLPIAGVCGPAHTTTIAAAPGGASLCSVGGPSAVAGTGPWNWQCFGANGGADANCFANLSAGPLPPPFLAICRVLTPDFSGLGLCTEAWATGTAATCTGLYSTFIDSSTVTCNPASGPQVFHCPGVIFTKYLPFAAVFPPDCSGNLDAQCSAWGGTVFGCAASTVGVAPACQSGSARGLSCSGPNLICQCD